MTDGHTDVRDAETCLLQVTSRASAGTSLPDSGKSFGRHTAPLPCPVHPAHIHTHIPVQAQTLMNTQRHTHSLTYTHTQLHREKHTYTHRKSDTNPQRRVRVRVHTHTHIYSCTYTDITCSRALHPTTQSLTGSCALPLPAFLSMCEEIAQARKTAMVVWTMTNGTCQHPSGQPGFHTLCPSSSPGHRVLGEWHSTLCPLSLLGRLSANSQKAVSTWQRWLLTAGSLPRMRHRVHPGLRSMQGPASLAHHLCLFTLGLPQCISLPPRSALPSISILDSIILSPFPASF